MSNRWEKGKISKKKEKKLTNQQKSFKKGVKFTN